MDVSESSVVASGTFRLTVGRSLRDMERELIYQTRQEVDDNRTQAAERLGISIRTLRYILQEYREETLR